jgi:hypothetical protein
MLVLAQMGFIPKDAKWYLADIVEEIRVEGDRRKRRSNAPDEFGSQCQLCLAELKADG